jgi:DNA polymerase-3 subunit delta'
VSAFIFAGENFSEVRNRAFNFAKKIHCESNEICGTCLSCRTFDSGNHPDTIFVKGTKQTGIGVDDVREQIIYPMAIKPFKYPHKIFIVEETLTPAAQNALLKTIEEPAPYGVFLFLSQNTHGFLPTVLSRCVVKKFSHENENSSFEALAQEIAHEIQGADIPAAFALYKKIEMLEKNALQEFLNSLYIFFGKIENIQKKISATDAISHAKKILSQNGNTQLAIELMLLNLR